TGWLNILFDGGALHQCCRGMDFYQIPRGAWAYFHGGELTGKPVDGGTQYYPGHFVSSNVYHPQFTILLGSLLMQFPADQSFYIWMWMKCGITLLVTLYFYWTFRASKYVNLAAFILLANISSYLEIAVSQFHAIFNILLLLLMMSLSKRQSFRSGMLYWLSL